MTVSNAYPFSPVVRIYPGGQPADASTWGLGTDISNSVRYPGSDGGQPITYSGGRPDEAATADPGELNLTLDNRSGDFSTENPLSPYYGLLRRGTPIRLSMVSGEDTFGRTVASGLGTSSGGGAWTANSSWAVDGSSATRAFAIANSASAATLDGAATFDFDIRATVWVEVVATGAALSCAVTARAVDVADGLHFRCEFGLTGALVAIISRRIDGAAIEDLASSGTLATTYSANDKIRIRAQGVGAELRMKLWKPASPSTPDADEPEAWDVTASESTVTAAGVGLLAWRRNGNTNAGSPVHHFDDFVSEAIEWTGSVIKWPVRWDKSGNNCWAPITAAGPLRRLRQATGTLRSPLARQLPAYNPTGYWPLEDGPQATQFGSAVTGVPPAARSNAPATATPAADTTLPGALQSPVFAAATASIRGETPRRQTGTGFSAMFLLKLAALPAAKTKIASFKGSGRIRTWNIYIDNVPNIYTEGIENDGTVTVNTNTSMGGISPLNWTAYQLETEYAAGSVDWVTLWHSVGVDEFLFQGGSYATSGASRVWWFQLGSGLSDLDGAAWAHVWLGENTLPFVDSTFLLVSNGYAGELAAARVQRLCDEEGVPVIVESGTSAALGAQPRNNFLDAITSAIDADMGILYEAGNGLGFRPQSARYNQAVTFALSVPDGEIDDPPEPVLDDQRLRNDWTVSREDGSFAQITDDVHIAAEGHWEDSATINVATDDVLADHAGWRVYLGTRSGWRWPDMRLNFARNASLIETWRSRRFAPRMTVTTDLDQVASADPDVIVEGYTAELWPHGWTVTLPCSDARPWDQLTLDNGLRLDAETNDDGTATCVLGEDLDTTETGIDVVTDTGLPVWADTTEINGTVITTGGEGMTVSATTGAGASQTLTAARSANGITKGHDTGGAVYLAQPTYLSL